MDQEAKRTPRNGRLFELMVGSMPPLEGVEQDSSLQAEELKKQVLSPATRMPGETGYHVTQPGALADLQYRKK
jgi:hypothetical protein